MSIIDNIILAGAIQGFFLSVLFLIKKSIVYHKLFALILFWVALAFAVAYVQNVTDIHRYPFLIKLNILFPLIFIPLLLIYLKKITGSYAHNRLLDSLLFVPLILITLINLPFYFGSNEMKIDYFIRYELSGNPSMFEIAEEIFVELTLSIYGFFAILEARAYKKRVDEVFSNHTKAKVGWIYFLSFSMFLLTFIAFLLSVGLLLIDNIPMGFHFITAIGATIIVYYIAWFFLLNPETLTEVSENLGKTTRIFNTEEPNQSKRNEALYQDFELKIKQLLEFDKLYLNPEITVGDLADKAGIPVYLTSKIINQNFNTNFYSLINKYRLEHVKQELFLFPKKTIIEIAYGSGFNSKTAFYEVFKKDTGISPSEFIKRIKSDKLAG